MIEITRFKTYLAALAVAAVGITAVGCGDDNNKKNDDLGDQIEKSANDVGDAASNTADDAANQIDDASDDAGKALQGDDKGKSKDGTK